MHSSLDGDQSVVYDNQRGDSTHDDTFIQVRSKGASQYICNNIKTVPSWIWFIVY